MLWAYIYVDPDGKVLGVEDVFSKLKLARSIIGRLGWERGF